MIGQPGEHGEKRLTAVSAGTPCGELLRRYWHPIAEASRVTTTPQRVRVLGEDLILFRDGAGRLGLLYPRCMHRGTTLYYGRVERAGIRCFHHGWLFDVEGRCLHQPCEPGGGRHLDRVRQPWYPVQERYGLVFAYLGPPSRRPLLPRYESLENLPEGQALAAFCGGFSASADPGLRVIPHSWLHVNDAAMDPYHAGALHWTPTPLRFDDTPAVQFSRTEQGVSYSAVRRLADDREVERVSAWFVPNVMTVLDLPRNAGPPCGICWFLPVDDTHYQHAIVARVPEGLEPHALPLLDGKRWSEVSNEEQRRGFAGCAVPVGEDPMPGHFEEHLVSSDRGIIMQRTLLLQQIDAVAQGRDPLGVAFSEQEAWVRVRAGTFIRSRSDRRAPRNCA